MAKKRMCALTHVRTETFFLAKWIEHYGAIVGRENLFVVLDGDDWEPEVDLSGINTTVVLDGPRRRRRNDQWAAKEMSKRANFLRKSYEFVIRGDVDEYVVIDPESSLSWGDAFGELGDAGYIFALGVDVVQAPTETKKLEKADSILSQRNYGFVSDRYTKPFVISRWNNWAGGAHRLLNRPVKISAHFVLFHMALCDDDIAYERMEARGGQAQHRSFVGYQNERLEAISETPDSAAMEYEKAKKIAFDHFPFEKDGTVAKRPRPSSHTDAVEKGLYTQIPQRFWSLV